MLLSKFRFVIRATDFTWPTFSAISTSTTGRNNAATLKSTVGRVKVGRPNQAASPTASKVTCPCSRAAT